jgi:hypothetical protein
MTKRVTSFTCFYSGDAVSSYLSTLKDIILVLVRDAYNMSFEAPILGGSTYKHVRQELNLGVPIGVSPRKISRHQEPRMKNLAKVG